MNNLCIQHDSCCGLDCQQARRQGKAREHWQPLSYELLISTSDVFVEDPGPPEHLARGSGFDADRRHPPALLVIHLAIFRPRHSQCFLLHFGGEQDLTETAGVRRGQYRDGAGSLRRIGRWRRCHGQRCRLSIAWVTRQIIGFLSGIPRPIKSALSPLVHAVATIMCRPANKRLSTWSALIHRSFRKASWMKLPGSKLGMFEMPSPR
ncbi:hypothetical protein F5Y16DRAFT_118139 [Xylariaceae sp. FL0255]|nr:hypothetical protein F5Y16DRAFT_118139 [Xylariaceae sp. FL0255]